MIEILPRSRIVHVQFSLSLPADATKSEVLEWVTFNLWGGSMSSDNPLDDYGVEAISEPVLTDTELHQHEELVVQTSGATIRRWADPRPFTGEKAIDQYVRTRGMAR